MNLPITLSNREVQVAQELLKFLPSKDIAANLFITDKTVKFHITRVYKKCQVKNRLEFFDKYSDLVETENKKPQVVKKKPVVLKDDELPIGDQETLDY